jgi:hypothetical protein
VTETTEIKVDWDKYEEIHGPLCLNCGCHHHGPPCNHDRNKPCRFCTRPVGALSTGGPDVCITCEVYGVPPDVFMGRRAPYDFHLQRENPEEYFRQQYENLKKAIEEQKLEIPK